MKLFFLEIAVDAVLLTSFARMLGPGLRPNWIDSGRMLCFQVSLVVSAGQPHLLRTHQDKHLFCYYFEVVLMSVELQLSIAS